MMHNVMQLIGKIDGYLEAMTITEHKVLAFGLLGCGGFLLWAPEMLRHVLQFTGAMAAIVAFYMLYQLAERENKGRYGK